jgi:hypothetical protein
VSGCGAFRRGVEAPSGIVPCVGTSLQIQLEDFRHSERRSPHSAGRYTTTASVRLLDAHTIVCCSHLACKISLIRFDLGFCQYTVVDSENTACGGDLTETTLCDIDGRGHVVTSNGEDGNMGLYGVAGDKIWHARDLPTVLPGNLCPSVRFCGPGVVAVAALGPPRGLHFLDISTMRTLLHVKTERPPQDVCFLPGNRAVLVMTDGASPSGGSDAEIQLIEYDLGQQSCAVIDRQPFAARDPVSVAFYEGRLYVVDSHGGRVLVLDARTLRQVDQLDGYDVPHGVDARYGILAVACYGSRSVHVRPIRWAR